MPLITRRRSLVAGLATVAVAAAVAVPQFAFADETLAIDTPVVQGPSDGFRFTPPASYGATVFAVQGDPGSNYDLQVQDENGNEVGDSDFRSSSTIDFVAMVRASETPFRAVTTRTTGDGDSRVQWTHTNSVQAIFAASGAELTVGMAPGSIVAAMYLSVPVNRETKLQLTGARYDSENMVFAFCTDAFSGTSVFTPARSSANVLYYGDTPATMTLPAITAENCPDCVGVYTLVFLNHKRDGDVKVRVL